MPGKVTQPTPLGPAADFGWALGVVQRAFHDALTPVLDDVPHGPRGFHILRTVVREDRPDQQSLAAHLGIDRSVMTYVVDDLVTAGLVERRANPTDRRQRKVEATEEGRRRLAELERRVEQAEDAVLAALNAEERATLCTLIRRVAASHDRT